MNIDYDEDENETEYMPDADELSEGDEPSPPKFMDDTEVISIVNNELSNSESYQDFETPLNYYLGNERGDEVKGRSKVVSTDVADAIEWIMPQVMKSFIQTKEVVLFDPLSLDDEMQAQLETEYTYDVLMKENPGFVIIYQMVKDALINKNGILKVYPKEEKNVNIDTFSGMSQDQLDMALASPDIEVVSVSMDMMDMATQQVTYTVQIKNTKTYKRIVVENVEPENFRVSNGHNSIYLDDARFTCHISRKTMSELRKDGFSDEVMKKLESLAESSPGSLSDFRFQAQGEVNNHPVTTDESMFQITVAECYMYMDYNGDGIAEYVKVTCGGASSDVSMDVSVLMSVEDLSDSPWVTTSAILMAHKFYGVSIYDRLRQIQDVKTSLLRNTLDNIRLQNNQRYVVLEGRVNVDDVLTSRPGGIIRAKSLDAVQPLVTPPIGQDAFTMMTYMDSIRAGRVGVSPEGEVTPQRIGERVGSQGVGQLLTAKEELVGLMVRLMAETGMKPLCVKIRDLCTKHLDAIQDYKFRETWVKINPSEWRTRTKTTVRVGTGTGNTQQQTGALSAILQAQQQISATPGQTLVDQSKIFAALDDYSKLSGLLGASKYFIDPQSPPGVAKKQQSDAAVQQQQQQAAQQQQMLLQAEVQLSQAELQKAQAQQDNVKLKAEIEQLKMKLADAESYSAAVGADKDRELKKYEIDTKAAVELTKIEVASKTQEEQNARENREALDA